MGRRWNPTISSCSSPGRTMASTFMSTWPNCPRRAMRHWVHCSCCWLLLSAERAEGQGVGTSPGAAAGQPAASTSDVVFLKSRDDAAAGVKLTGEILEFTGHAAADQAGHRQAADGPDRAGRPGEHPAQRGPAQRQRAIRFRRLQGGASAEYRAALGGDKERRPWVFAGRWRPIWSGVCSTWGRSSRPGRSSCRCSLPGTTTRLTSIASQWPGPPDCPRRTWSGR